MSCDNYRPFIGAYIDDEFDEREAAEFEAHLERCDRCRGELEEQLRLKQLVRESCGGEDAPDELREQILEGMREIDAEREGEFGGGSRLRKFGAVAAVVPLALGFVFAFWFTSSMTVAPAKSGQPPVIDQTVEWHQNNLPLEVPGPDRTHVAKWFQGKVGFPVRIPEFQKPGAELKGGRIAHVKNRRAGYLSYEVNGARMSVMMFHGDGLKIPADRVRKVGERDVAIFNTSGYEVAMLRDDGITYTITSDLSQKELMNVVASSME